jgi:hypothetical protein
MSQALLQSHARRTRRQNARPARRVPCHAGLKLVWLQNREEKPNPILKDISVMMRFEPKKNLPKTSKNILEKNQTMKLFCGALVLAFRLQKFKILTLSKPIQKRTHIRLH